MSNAAVQFLEMTCNENKFNTKSNILQIVLKTDDYLTTTQIKTQVIVVGTTLIQGCLMNTVLIGLLLLN